MPKRGRTAARSRVRNRYSVRLEHIREKIAGTISIKEFHKRLTDVAQSDGTPFDVSYSAARNYHYDREPPLSYVEQVAKVYGVRIEWLLTAEGPVRKEGVRWVVPDVTITQGAPPGVHAAFRDSLGALSPLGVSGTDAFVTSVASSVSSLMSLRGGSRGRSGDSLGIRGASTLAKAIAQPLAALGLQPEDWPESVKAQYVAHMIAALLVPLDIEADRLIRSREQSKSLRSPGSEE